MKTTKKMRQSTIVGGNVEKKKWQKWRLIRKNATKIKANVASGAPAHDEESTQYEATSKQVRISIQLNPAIAHPHLTNFAV